jgi:hypothetical protein
MWAISVMHVVELTGGYSFLVNSIDVGWLVLEPFIDSVDLYCLCSEFCKHFELLLNKTKLVMTFLKI